MVTFKLKIRNTEEIGTKENPHKSFLKLFSDKAFNFLNEWEN